jgi:hypothetical protein
MAGRMINGAAALAELIRPVGDTGDLGTHRVLPVLPELGGLLPSRGLRRGSTIAIGVTPGPSVHQAALPAATPPPHQAADGPGRGTHRSPRFTPGDRPTGDRPTSDRSIGERPLSERLIGERSASERPPGERSASERPPGERPAGGRAAGEAVNSGLASGAISFASGLRSAPTTRGGAATMTGGGSTSLLLALLAAASSAGSWCAVVGVPTLGALAAAESGIALDRLALVPSPGPEWPTVVAALIDGVDVVVVAVPGQVSASITSRLVARARQRGCVLVPYGRWDGADVTLQVTQGRWEGLGEGHGRLRRRKVTVVARGRGTAARPKEITMWMPGLAAPPPLDPVPGDPTSPRPRPTVVPAPEPDADEPAASARDADGNPPAPEPGPLASVTPITSAAAAATAAVGRPGPAAGAGAAPVAQVRPAAGAGAAPVAQVGPAAPVKPIALRADTDGPAGKGCA